MNETMERLKALAPQMEFSVDPMTGRVAAVINEMCIEDPWLSECGRFETTPDAYGIPMPVAITIFSHNLHCPTEEEIHGDAH